MITSAGSSISCTSTAPSPPVASELCNGTISGTTAGVRAAEIAEQQASCWQTGELHAPGAGLYDGDTNPNDQDIEWCGYFAGWVYQKAGLNFPDGPGEIAWVPNAATVSFSDHSYTYHAVRNETWTTGGTRYNDLVFDERGEHFDFTSDYQPDYTPQPGDLAIHTWVDDIPMDHVNVVVGVSGSGQNSIVKEIGGDQQPPNQSWSTTTSVVNTEGPEVESSSGAGIVGYLSPST